MILQTKTLNAGGYKNNFTFSADEDVTIGSLLIIMLAREDSSGVQTITDDIGNTWTRIAQSDPTKEQTTGGEMWYTINEETAPIEITIDMSGVVFHDLAIIFREYNNVVSLDTYADDTEEAFIQYHYSTQTRRLTNPNQLVIGGYAGSVNGTYTTEFDNLAQANGFDLFRSVALADEEVLSANPVSFSAISSGYMRGWVIVATFLLTGEGSNRNPQFKVEVDWNRDNNLQDESEYTAKIDIERSLSEPLGGVSLAQADIYFINKGGRMTPIDTTEINEVPIS